MGIIFIPLECRFSELSVRFGELQPDCLPRHEISNAACGATMFSHTHAPSAIGLQ